MRNDISSILLALAVMLSAGACKTGGSVRPSSPPAESTIDKLAASVDLAVATAPVGSPIDLNESNGVVVSVAADGGLQLVDLAMPSLTSDGSRDIYHVPPRKADDTSYQWPALTEVASKVAEARSALGAPAPEAYLLFPKSLETDEVAAIMHALGQAIYLKKSVVLREADGTLRAIAITKPEFWCEDHVRDLCTMPMVIPLDDGLELRTMASTPKCSKIGLQPALEKPIHSQSTEEFPPPTPEDAARVEAGISAPQRFSDVGELTEYLHSDKVSEHLCPGGSLGLGAGRVWEEQAAALVVLAGSRSSHVGFFVTM